MRILILEDETLASDKLSTMIREIDPEAEVISIIKSIESAVTWLRTNEHPDLILSDIHLLDGLCFEIFNQVKVDRPVIFTTAYDQYAIKAFEVNSIDYLLKPIQKEKLLSSLEKFKSRNTKSIPELNQYKEIFQYFQTIQQEYKSRFMVRIGQKIVAVPVEKIAYFYSENKLTFLITHDNKRYPLDQPLEELINQLDPKIFFRANRQFLVRFDAIAEIHPYFKGRIMIMLNPKADAEVVISADRTPAFKKWLDQ